MGADISKHGGSAYPGDALLLSETAVLPSAIVACYYSGVWLVESVLNLQLADLVQCQQVEMI